MAASISQRSKSFDSFDARGNSKPRDDMSYNGSDPYSDDKVIQLCPPYEKTVGFLYPLESEMINMTSE